jgi:hypothetical protein
MGSVLAALKAGCSESGNGDVALSRGNGGEPSRKRVVCDGVLRVIVIFLLILFFEYRC